MMETHTAIAMEPPVESVFVPLEDDESPCGETVPWGEPFRMVRWMRFAIRDILSMFAKGVVMCAGMMVMVMVSSDISPNCSLKA